jgi:GNAT superfamily N-acetyltransferase
MDAWAARGLGPHERLGDPAVGDCFQAYWLLRDDEVVGTIALDLPEYGWDRPRLTVASLYIFPELRRQGHAGAVMAALEAACPGLELGGVWLSTQWVWQPTVRFYLNRGFWVVNWKHELRLFRWPGAPKHRTRVTNGRVDFIVDGEPEPPLSAERDGNRLVWLEHPAMHDAPFDWQHTWVETFSLRLALLGWPLIRGDDTWERRYDWSDGGMPEGLAYKIGVFEAYDRHCGFPVQTPRIPGLPYPTWEELQRPE